MKYLILLFFMIALSPGAYSGAERDGDMRIDIDKTHISTCYNEIDTSHKKNIVFKEDIGHKNNTAHKNDITLKKDAAHKQYAVVKQDIAHKTDTVTKNDITLKKDVVHKQYAVVKRNSAYKIDTVHEISTSTGRLNIAYKWGEVAMLCTSRDTDRFKPRPTVTSRFLGLIWTAAFDAWSRYDKNAIPVYLEDVQRRPIKEHSLKNKEIAISYALYRTMLHYYFSDSVMLQNKMIEFGLDPGDTIANCATPAGIENLAAKSVLQKRMNDGANESGTMMSPGAAPYAAAPYAGAPYADYTGYTPVNSPDNLRELQRWQPKYFSDGNGGRFAPGCLTPHWNKVLPLLIDSASQFRPIPPPAIGSVQLISEIKQVVYMQASLTNEQKALIEFMRDGPKSVQQAGHWFIFAQSVSVRDKHTLDHDVKMFFLLEAAAMDAFIACWDAKMYYDFARPYSLVHDYYKDSVIKLWGGADKGMISAKGSEWRPYSPETFLCPPFPSYVSGHSTVSAACAESLRLFTGNDYFGEEVKRVPGEFTEPGNLGDTVTLKFDTFTETAELAGISRVLGGYHIQSDNIEGLKLGRDVAKLVYRKYLSHIAKQ